MNHTQLNDLPAIYERMVNDGPVVERECGSCTACCTVLAIAELHKPARWACDHVDCSGCGIYEARPQSCRDFHCAWLRGEISGNGSLRPDRLGVMFDYFYSTVSRKERSIAFELWNGAFDEAPAADLLREIAASRELDLSYRDGRWRTIGTTDTVDTQGPASVA